MSFGERMKKVRLKRGMTLLEVAERLGKTEATVQRYESGNIKNLKSDTILEISSILNISPAYLMGWEEGKKDVIKEPAAPYNFFPQSISAGIPLQVDGITEAEEIELPDSVLGKWAGNSDLFIMKINGESMNRVIPDKSLIAVKPIELHQLKDGDIVVYSDGGDYSVKRYYLNGDEIVFRPDSHDTTFFEQRYKTTDSITIHGKVVVYIVELD